MENEEKKPTDEERLDLYKKARLGDELERSMENIQHSLHVLTDLSLTLVRERPRLDPEKDLPFRGIRLVKALVDVFCEEVYALEEAAEQLDYVVEGVMSDTGLVH